VRAAAGREIAYNARPMETRAEARAESEAQARARHEENRAAWNEGAAEYARDNAGRLERLKARRSHVHPVERENLARFGPLASWCRRAIHLQCASGEDSLSLWIEGAHEVIGVDISDLHVENARWLAEALGAPARFLRSDVLDTPAELDGTADLVYTGRGALNWLQDLPGWAAVAARLLRPGGVLHLLEDHPFTWFLELEARAPELRPIDYFDHGEASRGWPSSYLGRPGEDPADFTPKHERLHTMAGVFTALRGAGLDVVHLGEHREEYWDVFPNLPAEVKRRLPLTYSMMAVKP
jgi:SAM-dependent methyltransferase